MLLSDRDICRLVRQTGLDGTPMISPFEASSISIVQTPAGVMKIPSFGLSSAGYDLRLAMKDPLVMTRPDKETAELVIDARLPDQKLYKPLEVFESPRGRFYEIPPGGYVLDSSVERFHLPRNIAFVCVGKSTLARLGVIVNVTPAEPGWQGYLTLEIHNTSEHRLRLWQGDGITQALFFQLSSDPDICYADRSGKYQNQPPGPVQAR